MNTFTKHLAELERYINDFHESDGLVDQYNELMAVVKGGVDISTKLASLDEDIGLIKQDLAIKSGQIANIISAFKAENKRTIIERDSLLLTIKNMSMKSPETILALLLKIQYRDELNGYRSRVEGVLNYMETILESQE